jgi:hypothetical protein
VNHFDGAQHAPGNLSHRCPRVDAGLWDVAERLGLRETISKHAETLRPLDQLACLQHPPQRFILAMQSTDDVVAEGQGEGLTGHGVNGDAACHLILPSSGFHQAVMHHSESRPPPAL